MILRNVYLQVTAVSKSCVQKKKKTESGVRTLEKCCLFLKISEIITFFQFFHDFIFSNSALKTEKQRGGCRFSPYEFWDSEKTQFLSDAFKSAKKALNNIKKITKEKRQPPLCFFSIYPRSARFFPYEALHDKTMLTTKLPKIVSNPSF